MKLLVGLGNPGSQYAKQRHNVGFMVLDEIASRHGFPAWRNKFQGQFSEGTVGNHRALLLKPQTFMNRSGQSVGEVARFYKIPLGDIVVFHDELDLAAGKLRVKVDGGVAGHNGLRSIDQWLGSKAFKRVRIGIGHPGHKDRVTAHVLGDFAKADKAWLEQFIDAVAANSDRLVAGQDAEFMNGVALVLNPPKPKPDRDKRPASTEPRSKD